jgi:formate hydrogenlyase transcriptional activator
VLHTAGESWAVPRNPLALVRTTAENFTREDIDFLSQAAGQIAIAIEMHPLTRTISNLKGKLAQEKLYLEEEIRAAR